MNIVEPFIRRPVMTSLVMISILIFGVMGYRQLPVNDLPNVDFPAISVTASFPGASPETMAASVATPLERQFSTISGIDSMNSVSSQGRTNITLVFALDRDIDAAAQDVQSAISAATRRLPDGMPDPPSYSKSNPADQPILYLSLSSSILPLSQVNEYAETLMAQRISMISGVSQVQVYGSQKYAVRIQLDPKTLASRGDWDRRSGQSRAERQRQPSHGNSLWPEQGFHGSGRGAVGRRGSLSASHRGLSQRDRRYGSKR